MKLEDFKALEVGQRVVVNGVQSRLWFVNAVGTIMGRSTNGGQTFLIKFDHWSSGHGEGNREWYFGEEYCADFVIEPEHRSTYLNGHSDLKQEGVFVTAWVGEESVWLTADDPFSSLEEADNSADRLARMNPGDTVAVLRVVRKHTSSVTVEAKTV